MAQARGPPVVPEEGRLDERVLTTLQGLSGRLAFSGLRRVLGTHPESLSRSLHRLEREGLIQRVDGGYRALARPPTMDARTVDQDLRSIAEIALPPGVDRDAFLGRLAGRWFGTLRWVGLLERAEGELLAWARREGGSLVLLGLRRGTVRVYLSQPREGNEDPSEAEEAAYELLFHAVEALRPTSVGPETGLTATVRAFTLGPPSVAWGS